MNHRHDPEGHQPLGSATEGAQQSGRATAYFAPRACVGHEMGEWHPECPGRLDAIEDQMIASGTSGIVIPLSAPLAQDEDIERVHLPEYIARVRALAPAAGYVTLDPDTMLGPGSLEAVLSAAGAAVAATDAVIAGEVRNAFCSIRPPGHHACVDRPMGFCVINNVAVAARRALDVHGLERVAIVDFDVHHGNGTEDIFSDDARVLMVSFFQHPFYPYSGAGAHAANMVNVPLPAGTDGAVARRVVDELWVPALERFEPQMIFISAGFDAHREDDLGQMRLVEDDYAWITRRLMELAERYAGGRIVSCLEGGYNLSALGRSVVAHVKVLAGS
jgi:acetoin utilization deacetylase AcuC-like enzyme